MSTIRGLRVNADRTISEVDVPIDGLAVMQDIVGGYIEGVRMNVPGGRMYVNESGLIHGLPLNRIASMFYPGPTPIVGDVLVLGDVDYEGYDTSITPEVEAAVRAIASEFALLTELG
jgi:Domain of unknown function (DUF3846)